MGSLARQPVDPSVARQSVGQYSLYTKDDDRSPPGCRLLRETGELKLKIARDEDGDCTG